MKKILLTSYTILFSILIACSDIETGQPVDLDYFYKLYGGFDNDYILSVQEMDDGGLFISGFTSEEWWNDEVKYNEVLTRPYLCKILPTGMVDWDTVLREGYDYAMAYDIIQLKHAPEVLTAIAQAYNNDTTLLHILKVRNSVLDTMLTAKIKAKQINNAQIVELSNGGLRIVLQLEDQNSLIRIYELTDNNSLSALPFDANLQPGEISGKIKVEVASEDLIVIGATVNENNQENSTTDVRVIATFGKLTAWDRKNGGAGISETCEDIKIVDENIVVVGNQTQDGKQEFLNLTLEPTGGKITKQLTFSVDEINTPVCRSFTVNDSNNFVYTGYSVLGDKKSDIIFVEATQEGDVVRINTFGSDGKADGENKGKSIHCARGEGYYFLAGEMEPINNSDICLFKLNKFGKWVD